MEGTLKPDLCIIGAGSGGLTVAAGAAQMGAEVVLVEKGKMGGDCLNYGCVPSKALLAAGKRAEMERSKTGFGIACREPIVDFAAVNDHVKDVIAGIAPHDSVERFEGLGVKVIQAQGRFTGSQEVSAGGVRIRARRFVVATGSSPGVPPIDGLSNVAYLTNETVFELREAPEHLLVVGGGPIGAELAQAHRRLGSRVTILEMFTLLGKDDPEAAEFVRARLASDGIEILEGVEISSVEKRGDGVAARVKLNGQDTTIEASHLLVAAGRRANVNGLGLDEAGIAYSPKRIEVDKRLRTSNKRVFAIGDVAGGYQFTHVAGYHGGIVIRNALFRLPAKAEERTVPWVTFTDPELAQVGLTEAEARDEYGDALEVLRWSFAENDRARAERETEGLVKVMVGKRGRILGATIVGAHAGELIQPWILALQEDLKIGAMASYIAPYPTMGEVNKRAAGSYYTARLFGRRMKALVRFLSWFG